MARHLRLPQVPAILTVSELLHAVATGLIQPRKIKDKQKRLLDAEKFAELRERVDEG